MEGLEDKAEVATSKQGWVGDVGVRLQVHEKAAGRRHVEHADQVEQARLAATAGADHGDELGLANVEIQPVERARGPAVELQRESFGANQGLHPGARGNDVCAIRRRRHVAQRRPCIRIHFEAPAGAASISLTFTGISSATTPAAFHSPAPMPNSERLITKSLVINVLPPA